MALPTPSGRQRLSGPERRAAIVDSAVNLFSERGFRGTTTRELAAAVGVSEPVLYQHFRTKRALYDAILESQTQEPSQEVAEEMKALSETGDNRALFRRLAQLLIDFYLRDPRYPRLLMFSSLEGHELSQIFYERHVACFYEFLTAHIQRQIDAGVFRPVDPLIAARCFAGMLSHQGLIFSVLHPGNLAAPADQIVEVIVDLFLGGISA
ncbi:MAG: TetR/AcrR family transcriptional regulator [Bryobacterales bacterium]|nr:TetR/AcrR family transcriptional regulator [Bryobacterales bacterium]